jgi:hypothetical protein
MTDAAEMARQEELDRAFKSSKITAEDFPWRGGPIWALDRQEPAGSLQGECLGAGAHPGYQMSEQERHISFVEFMDSLRGGWVDPGNRLKKLYEEHPNLRD